MTKRSDFYQAEHPFDCACSNYGLGTSGGGGVPEIYLECWSSGRGSGSANHYGYTTLHLGDSAGRLINGGTMYGRSLTANEYEDSGLSDLVARMKK